MSYQSIKPYITNDRLNFFKVAEKYISIDDKVLDVGAGDGAFAGAIKKGNLFFLDGNKEAVEALKRQFSNVFYGQLPDLPFDADSFHVIHCSHVIEHLEPQQFYDFIKNCDACLKVGGYMIFSAPLSWPNFYDDLSHVKPYTPVTFQKYLVWGDIGCATRPLISDKYTVTELLYRYYEVPPAMVVFKRSALIDACLQFTRKLFRKIGFRTLGINGFTLVLRKRS